MTKRITAFLLAVFLMLGILSGCSPQPQDNSGKISIVCTIAPVYDWITEIVGEKAELFEISFLSGGGDLHSFQPTAKDMAEIYTCDLLLTIGGESDIWTKDTELSEQSERLSLFELTGDDDELILPDAEEHHHEEHSDTEYDEHLWLSLKMADRLISGICEAICKLDPQNGVIYRKNTAEYCQKLKLLDRDYTLAAEAAEDKTIIFADRFPFAYMMRDYGILCYTAFPGCSSDAEASFETVAQLCEAVKAHKKETVLVLEGSNATVADAINQGLGDTKVSTRIMDSCQIVADIDSFDYTEVMQKNLDSLRAALK